MTTMPMISEPGLPSIGILAYQSPIRGSAGARKKSGAKKGAAKKGAGKKGAGKKGSAKKGSKKR